MKRLILLLAFSLTLVIGGTASADVLVNSDGGICLDAEGGMKAGAKVIAYTCHGGNNQQVQLTRGRLIVGNSMCVTARKREKGSELYLAGCDYSSNGDALQNFAWWGNGTIGHNTGFILAAASRSWSTNRPLCLWNKEGRADQTWRLGTVLRYTSGMKFNSATKLVMIPGKQGAIVVRGGQLITDNGAGVISRDGAGLISNGSSIVSGGAGN
jgi:hypothetical protein